ncbi:MAG TPA: hypothetical protein VGD78_19940 [Chthoniobacterales bacterium]
MELYQHVRVVVSILVGFSLTHLLGGLARLIQHPSKEKVYWVHLLWALFVFFYVITFWWWEYRLEQIRTWTFALYLLVIVYGILLYLLCALLFPEELRDYRGYREYFFQRRQWFFGTLAMMWIIDYADTLIKGRTRLHTLGLEYEIRVVVYLACSLIAMKTKNPRFHAVFAVVGVLYELSFICRQYFIVA